MKTSTLNYDRIAGDYNQRYPSAQSWERGQALLDLSKHFKQGQILEVGSGTGYWLNLLHQHTSNLFGLDYSMGMLQQAQGQPAPLKLLRGSASQLPYQENTFDLVFSVDAIHHFGDHCAFIQEAFRVLKPGGALATIGHDPHGGTTNWYIYNYFDGVYDTDLRRYPAGSSLLKWMEAEGFQNNSFEIVEHIRNIHMGRSVLKEPFIKHNATSQLALLSEGEYQAGIQRIKAAIKEAEAKNEQAAFSSDIQVKMFLGYKPR